MSKTSIFKIILVIFVFSQSLYSQTKPKHIKTKITYKPVTVQIEPIELTIVSGDLRQIYEKSVETESGRTLTASSVAGDIEISTWDKNEVEVKVMGNDEAERKLLFDAYKTDEGVKIDCGQKKQNN